MATRPNIHSIPRGRQAQILDKTIQSIFVVAHAKEENTNHTCFYLITGKDESVQLDCIPDYSDKGTVILDGYKANLVLSELDCLWLDSAEKVSRLDVLEGSKVGDVLDTILREKRDRYEFTPEGTGCRLWVTDQIALLLKEGYVTDREQVNNAQEAIEFVWPDQIKAHLGSGKYF